MFKFALDEKVHIKNENKTGTIIKMEHVQKIDPYGNHIMTKYFVNYGQYWENKWYVEDELRREYEFNEDVLKVVNKVLIDAALDNGNFELAKELANEIK